MNYLLLEQGTFDQICPTCAKVLTQTLVDDASGKVGESALPFIRRILGSETSS